MNLPKLSLVPVRADTLLDSRIITDRIQFLSSDPDALTKDEQTELRELGSLASECEGAPDWHYGETLIRDDYFTEYARLLAYDIGAVKGTEGWPHNCIDWEKAAAELKPDYFTAEYYGHTYWIRG